MSETSLTTARVICNYGNSEYTGSNSSSSSATAIESNPSIQLLSQDLAIHEALNDTYKLINTAYLNGNYQINMSINTISYITNISNIIYVTNLNDSGEGSFRQAIIESNLTTPLSKIIFNVIGKITLLSNLERITSPVSINGSSNAYYIDTPVIEIDCNNYEGIIFDKGSDNSYLIGLTVVNALYNGITINASYITLDKNYILYNGENGIFIETTSSNNIIGLNKTNSSTIKSNLISGNKMSGIYLNRSLNNTIQNNYIGTDETGENALPNLYNGIYLIGSSDNIIGGKIFINDDGIINNPTGSKGNTTPVFIKLPLGNIISGNGMNGIHIDTYSSNNNLYGNFIGTTKDGNTALKNNLNGVYINNSLNINLIGCDVYNNPFVYYNVISGNTLNGLYITDSVNITVQGNFFGISANNSVMLPNSDGIKIDGNSSDITVGGIIPLGNVCSGNKFNGINVTGNTKSFTSFNTFGGLYAFGDAAPNGEDGIQVSSKEKGNLIRTCVFSGNTGNGINLNNANYVKIDPVICGLYTNGKQPLPNGKNGLLIQGDSQYNLVCNTNLDYASVITTNIFSGNTENGILIKDTASNNNIINAVVGLNVFGTTVTDTTTVGNSLNGILITDTTNTNIINDCLISNNQNDGIILTNNTYNNIVTNCEIGYDVTTIQSAPNLNEQVNNNSISNIIINNHIYP